MQRVAVKEQTVARLHFSVHGFQLLKCLLDTGRLRADLAAMDDAVIDASQQMRCVWQNAADIRMTGENR